MKKLTNKNKILRFSYLFLLSIFLIISLFYISTINKFKTSLVNKDLKIISEFAQKNSSFIYKPLNYKFTNILDKELTDLSTNYKNKNLSEEKYLELLSLYKNLDLCNQSINEIVKELPIVKESKNNFNNALILFDKGDYEASLELFEKINENTIYYDKAIPYIDEVFENLTVSTFTKTESLIKNTNYTEAINLLEESKKKLNNIIDITNIEKKIDEIKNFRMQHLYEYSKSAILNNINNASKLTPYFGKLTKDNINDFNIKSKTNKLIFTDIQKQRTYIFKGSNKNWTLEKEFICSTGIDNKETVVGYFEVAVKAPWFFSPKYGQGAKNYIQFDGNYLYHSLPFDNTQTKILDYTLGEPASHGCIRLAVDDSKWLYDNIIEGSTILIF